MALLFASSKLSVICNFIWSKQIKTPNKNINLLVLISQIIWYLVVVTWLILAQIWINLKSNHIAQLQIFESAFTLDTCNLFSKVSDPLNKKINTISDLKLSHCFSLPGMKSEVFIYHGLQSPS